MIDPTAKILLGLATYGGRRYYLLEEKPGRVLLCTGDGATTLWVPALGVALKRWKLAYSLKELQARKP